MMRIGTPDQTGLLETVPHGTPRTPEAAEETATPDDGANGPAGKTETPVEAGPQPAAPPGFKWLGDVSPNFNMLNEIEKLRGRYSTDPLAEQFGSSREGTYAKVVVDGEVVAVVFNGGGASIASDRAAEVGDLPRDGHGPDLAARRAEIIAQALGGTVERTDTAVTQEDFDAGVRPSAEAVDTEAMKRDGVYEAWNALTSAYNRLQSAKTLIAAMEVGATDRSDLPDRPPVSEPYRTWGR